MSAIPNKWNVASSLKAGLAGKSSSSSRLEKSHSKICTNFIVMGSYMMQQLIPVT
jgi:hypothetical protein